MEYKTHYLSFLINNFHNALHRSAAHIIWKNIGDTCRIGIITNIATNHEMIIFDQKFCTFKCTFFTHKKITPYYLFPPYHPRIYNTCQILSNSFLPKCMYEDNIILVCVLFTLYIPYSGIFVKRICVIFHFINYIRNNLYNN